jgi:hypothetical protein
VAEQPLSDREAVALVEPSRACGVRAGREPKLAFSHPIDGRGEQRRTVARPPMIGRDREFGEVGGVARDHERVPDRRSPGDEH